MFHLKSSCASTVPTSHFTTPHCTTSGPPDTITSSNRVLGTWRLISLANQPQRSYKAQAARPSKSKPGDRYQLFHMEPLQIWYTHYQRQKWISTACPRVFTDVLGTLKSVFQYNVSFNLHKLWGRSHHPPFTAEETETQGSERAD